MTHAALGVQLKVLRTFWAPNMRELAELQLQLQLQLQHQRQQHQIHIIHHHPEHDFEGVQSRNPTNSYMRWSY